MARKRVEAIEDLKGVYYIYGDEELLAEQAVKRLKNLFGAQADVDFNMEVLDAAELGASAVINAAETVPLMSSRRLVIAMGADRLGRREQEAICTYLDDPNPAATLVLVALGGPGSVKRDAASMKKVEGSPLFKKVGSVGGEPLKFTLGGRGSRKKVEEWIADEFERRGKRVEPSAGSVLLERVGRELRDLEDAIERICLYAADEGAISSEHVVKVVVPAAEQGVFELIDAVGDRRRDQSLYLLDRLMRQGESPQRIFSLLLRQFRLIARCKAMARDTDHPRMASALGIPPFLVSKCVRQSSRFSPEKLRAAFLEFKKAQMEMHSNRYLPERDYQAAMLEMLIVRLIG